MEKIERKNKNIERLVKYSLPVMLVLVLLGLYWVGSNSLVIGTTISTVDRELKGAFLERDAYNSKMKEVAMSKDSLEAEFHLSKLENALKDSVQRKKIDSLIIITSNEKKDLEAVVNDFRNYRDSVDKVRYKRSAVEDRYKEEQR